VPPVPSAIVFHFHDERRPAAVTEVEGEVTDMLLPGVGDTLSHADLDGSGFLAQVPGRHFEYDLEDGEDVSGRVSSILSLSASASPLSIRVLGTYGEAAVGVRRRLSPRGARILAKARC